MSGRGWAALALSLVCLLVLTHLGSLEREDINRDEATFAIIASAWKAGALPYTTLFDNKPPMIFALLAGAMAMFGESLWTVRLFGAGTILVSTILVFALARRVAGPGPAVLAALLCVAAHAIEPAQYTSTELPAAAFLLGATWLLVARPRSAWAMAGAGGLISLAVLTRSNLGLVAVACGVWLAVMPWLAPGLWRRGAVLFYTAGGLVPLGVLLALYAAAGALDVFVLATVTVPLSYAGNQASVAEVLTGHLQRWGHECLRHPLWVGGLTLAAGLGLACLLGAQIRRPDRETGLIALIAGAAVLSILISGVSYPHYWLQVLPYAVLAAAALFQRLWTLPAGRALAAGLVALILLSALRYTAPEALRVVFLPGDLEQKQVLRQTAAELAPDLRPNDRVWAAERHLILWYLGLQPIEPIFTHPANAVRPSIVTPLIAAGYTRPDPLGRLYADPPAFVITASRPPFYLKDTARFERFIEENFRKTIERPSVTVWERRDHYAQRAHKPRAAQGSGPLPQPEGSGSHRP